MFPITDWWRWPRKWADWVLRFYQATLSHWYPGCCRFQPTCSQYAREAIAKYGLLWGGAKAVFRILRCHPFSRGGPDPLK
jgi:putative membrane protein insertion efficiency factor